MDYSAYQAVEQDSSDVVGCGFFHVGCEEKALTFPAYQPGFHIKGYRRVNLWGKDKPWTDTELEVKIGDLVYIYGTGEVTICPNCKDGLSGPQKLNQVPNILSSKIGSLGEPVDLNSSSWRKLPLFKIGSQFQDHPDAYLNTLGILYNGNLQIVVRDWETYPPPSNYYDDNSGDYILDIFVIDPNQEEGFGRFRNALFEANPNDANAKAYLGR
jgi:hypothetical protein